MAVRRDQSSPPKFPIGPELWRDVVSGMALSPRQARMVELLLQGKRTKEIADTMGLAEPTVKTYLSRVFHRVGVRDRFQLVVRVFTVAMSLAAGNDPAACHPNGRHPK